MRYFKVLALFALVNAGIILVFQPFTISGDSVSYFETGELLRTGEGVVHASRLLKPFGPLLATWLGAVSGQGVQFGLLAENTLFYIFTVPLIFAALWRVTRNERTALWGSIVYLSAYPFLAHGITYMTDMSGWFFSLLVIYATLVFLDTALLRYAFLTGIAGGIGILFKEYVVAGGLFFALAVLTEQAWPWRRRVAALVACGVPALALFLSWQVHVFSQYGATYADWYATGGVGKYMLRDIPFMVKSVAAVFLVGWVPVLLGVRYLLREGDERIKRIAVLLIAPSLMFLLWHVASSRIYFVSGLLLALLAAVYGEQLFQKNRYAWLTLLSVIVVANYAWFIWGDAARPALWPWIQ